MGEGRPALPHTNIERMVTSMPSKRTMVIATAGEYCIDFRTVSWWKKSPRRFVIVRERLENLCDEQTEIVSDIHCFAALRRSQATGLLTIDFTWLSGGFGGEVKGWEESVSIPYEPLLTFMRESAQEGGPEVWKHLSVCQTSRPRLVFRAQERLRECVTNRVVRKKLSHALRDNFRYSSVERIEFYHDFAPYSFFFQETRRDGRAGVAGGFIFHNHDGDLSRGYYSVHT